MHQGARGDESAIGGEDFGWTVSGLGQACCGRRPSGGGRVGGGANLRIGWHRVSLERASCGILLQSPETFRFLPFFETPFLILPYTTKCLGTTQVTINYDKRFFLFDRISKKARLSELLSPLKARLGSESKNPVHVRLMRNGRLLEINETMEQVCQ
jgi:hypothetical protein